MGWGKVRDSGECNKERAMGNGELGRHGAGVVVHECSKERAMGKGKGNGEWGKTVRRGRH